MKKVVLFLVDGMRPDGLVQARTPVLDKLMEEGAYTLTAQTVMPSVTLPCHMSLFHSVLPERHGVTTNTYTPQVRPVPGLFEVIHLAELKAAAFYSWDELRDISRPGSLHTVFHLKDSQDPDGPGDTALMNLAREWLRVNEFDFAYVYLGFTDNVGHKYGWMSEKYLQAISQADECIGRVLGILPKDTTILVTSDHGGHDQTHGTPSAEDMTIPLIVQREGLIGQLKDGISILDIAPTIVKLLGLKAPKEWVGKSIVEW
jgi:predicted AlkP superfamily pyrophosphatase or phosphodiesterase